MHVLYSILEKYCQIVMPKVALWVIHAIWLKIQKNQKHLNMYKSNSESVSSSFSPLEFDFEKYIVKIVWYTDR